MTPNGARKIRYLLPVRVHWRRQVYGLEMMPNSRLFHYAVGDMTDAYLLVYGKAPAIKLRPLEPPF